MLKEVNLFLPLLWNYIK